MIFMMCAGGCQPSGRPRLPSAYHASFLSVIITGGSNRSRHCWTILSDSVISPTRIR